MSATETIRQIAKLPAAERAQVIDYVRQLSGELSGVRYAEDAEADVAADKVFAGHPDLLKKLAQ